MIEKILHGIIDNQDEDWIIDFMEKENSIESIKVYNILAKRQNEYENFDAITRILLKNAMNNNDLYFSEMTMKSVFSYLQNDKLMSTICTRGFVNNKNFAAVCIIFREFERKMKKEGNDQALDLCKMFHSGDKEIFNDDQKSATFVDLENPKTLSTVLYTIQS